jgi:glycosyltransferase involved in cell wall biosynthesis
LTIAKNIQISFVVPAHNEKAAIGKIVEEVSTLHPLAEIIVVDDGSTDGTGEIAKAAGAIVVRHPISLGNGAAIKSGARVAKGGILVFMDGDGQHVPRDVSQLLELKDEGYDLVVGARSNFQQHSSFGRWLANSLYNKFASIMTASSIRDLTSGFRVVDREKFLSILHLLPNKFSYPTTSTMAFLRMGYSVGFVPVNVKPGLKGSHIRPLRDGVRFAVIIFKIAMLFSPFKVLFPLSVFQIFGGLALYFPGLISGVPVFTNGMALLVSGGIFTLSVAILSEQATALLYKK